MVQQKYLIVVDMQNDFITGSLGTKEAQAIVPNVIQHIKERREQGYAIIATMDSHTVSYMTSQEGKRLPVEHCMINTDGWMSPDEIRQALGNVRRDYKIKPKPTFGTTDWDYYIQTEQPKEIELIGVCTDICVVSNALILKALYPEARISVKADCCAGTTPEKHQAALEVMKSCQIDIE